MAFLEFSAETNPLITAIMESTSEGDWEKLGKVEVREDNDQPMLVVWKGHWRRKIDECSLLRLFFFCLTFKRTPLTGFHIILFSPRKGTHVSRQPPVALVPVYLQISTKMWETMYYLGWASRPWLLTLGSLQLG
jgi:hypothetical protein